MKIENEINQQQFNKLQHKAGMNLIFTANWLLNEIAVALKPIGLSLQQLNALSILKGQPNHTATVNLIRERLIDRKPNVSRLLNKLMEKELIKKDKDLSDQRVVYVKLTAKGLESADIGRRLFDKVKYNISDNQSETLSIILDQLRS